MEHRYVIYVQDNPDNPDDGTYIVWEHVPGFYDNFMSSRAASVADATHFEQYDDAKAAAARMLKEAWIKLPTFIVPIHVTIEEDFDDKEEVLGI